ncbi:MAG: HAMP domain-containing protein [Deltaproteobacteria bacterium]|nr:HAMP domain-containing protein [Deltaproteobacteria bacterium]
MSLRQKIFGGYGLALCLIGVVSAWAFVALRDLGRASDAILRENYKSILAAENMIQAIERQDSASLLFLLGYADEGVTQFSENESLFLQWLARAKDNLTVEGEGGIVDGIDSGYQTYLLRCSKLRLLHRSDPEGARRMYHEAVLPSFRTVRDLCGRLHDLNERTMVRASDRARAISATARWSGAVTSFAAVALGLGFSLILSNLLVRPLRQLMAATKRLADGDYDVEVTAPSRDELGLLAREFNGMATKLKAFHDLNVGEIMAEKVKSEAIIRSMDDGVVVVDAALRVSDLNPTAAKIFSIDAGGARDRHFLEVVRDELLFQLVKQAVESGQTPPIEEGKDVLTVPQGKERHHFHFSILPILPAAGPMLGVVLILRDVTRLKEIDRLKSEFVLTASHELRTPLTSMGLAIDLLLEGGPEKLSDQDRQLLSAAHEELERLKALVNDLLDLSKIEAGKVDLDLAATDVRALCDRAASAVTGQLATRAVHLTMTIPEGFPDVKADETRITWVLINLLSNAQRYVDDGGHITVSAEHLGDRVHIRVTDDGPGIPYEYQSKIFDKFVQLKVGREAGGSGLGLAICREIVRAHGGTIWVESVPGEGSQFTFTLPVEH